MNAEQRIRLLIGDLVVQLEAAKARIEELEADKKATEAPKTK